MTQLQGSQEERVRAPFLSLVLKSAPPSTDWTWPTHFEEGDVLASIC